MIGQVGGLGAAALPSFAAELQPGRDYTHIKPPPPSATPGKIEVLEFFSYGCPHCRDFHPLITAWAAKLPADVEFRRVPVSFGRAAWANLARLHHALDILGELERLDKAVFRAIHAERINLYTEKSIRQWVVRQGVEAERFAAAYGSFGVNARLSRDDQLTRSHQVRSVPLLTVGGRYAVLGEGASGYPDLLAIADRLIALARG